MSKKLGAGSKLGDSKWMRTYIRKSVIYLVPKYRRIPILQIYNDLAVYYKCCMYWMLKWWSGLPYFALKFAPWQFAVVVCQCFSDKVSWFAYRRHDFPERTEMDWNRQKRACKSRNWLYVDKQSWNFLNYIKIISEIEKKIRNELNLLISSIQYTTPTQ